MQHILLAYFGEHARRNSAALMHEDNENFCKTLDAGRDEMVDLFDRSYRAFGKQAAGAHVHACTESSCLPQPQAEGV